MFVNLWPISTLCVADMVHVVADDVCGRYGCGRYGLWLTDIVVSQLLNA